MPSDPWLFLASSRYDAGSMKYLILLRHAKSSWEDQGLADFDRPLAPRGEKDAPRMGRALKEASALPDLVVCSTATRARQTAARALKAAGYTGPVRHDDRIYEASVETLFEVLQSIDDDVETAMLVGHNPGFEMLIGSLIGASGRPANVRVPTATLARLELAATSWKSVKPGSATLIWHLIPRCV